MPSLQFFPCEHRAGGEGRAFTHPPLCSSAAILWPPGPGKRIQASRICSSTLTIRLPGSKTSPPWLAHVVNLSVKVKAGQVPIPLPTPSFFDPLSQARGPGRLPWQHEALFLPGGVGQNNPPAPADLRGTPLSWNIGAAGGRPGSRPNQGGGEEPKRGEGSSGR